MEQLTEQLVRKSPERSWYRRTFSGMSEGSMRSSIVTLSSCAIGAGLLSLPFAVKECGVVIGLAMLILSGLSFAFFYRVLIWSLDYTKKKDYTGVVTHLFGVYWRRIFELSLIITEFGSCCAYQALMVQFSGDFLGAVGVELPSFFFFMMNGIVMIIAALLSIPKNITSLRYLSMTCILMLVYITLVVMVQAPSYISQNDVAGNITYFNLSIRIMHSLSILLFSYCSIVSLPLIYDELQHRSYRRAAKVIDRSLFLMFVLYGLLGFLGYFSYIENVPELVIDREKGSTSVDWPMIIAKGILACSLMPNYVLTIHPLRQAIEISIFGINPEYNSFRFYCINFSSILLIGCFATAFPRVVNYFTFIGGFTMVIVSVVIPAMIFWKLSNSKLMIALVTIWSALISTAGFGSAIMTILGY